MKSLAEREALIDVLVPMAEEFACLVRDEGVDSVERFLRRVPDLPAFCVVLAAMVPIDRCSRAELLGWVPDQVSIRDLAREWDDERLKACHSAYYHGERGDAVVAGEREYQARRKRAQMAARRAAA